MENKSSGVLKRIISFIFTILIIVLIGFVAWFCVDYFGIVELPEEMSIIALIGQYDSYVLECDANIECRDETIVQPRKRTINVVNAETSNDTGSELDDIFAQIDANKDNNSNNKKNKANSKNYYYNQLNENAKYIYDAIYDNYENLKTGTYVIDFGNHFNDLCHKENGENILNDSFQLALNTLTFDKPELYFINVTKMYLYSNKTTFPGFVRYKHSIGPAKDDNYLSDDFENEEDTINAISRIDQKIEQVIEEANHKENDVEKIRYIHDYILDCCQYDSSSKNKNLYNAYGVLNDGRAVCEGYAKTMKLLLDKIDIENIVVCGTGTNSSGQVESHAWNYILVDGVWYGLDSTWDDPILLGTGVAPTTATHKYFLVGSEKLNKDHVASGILIGDLNENFEFKYPTLSINDYKE